MPRVNVSGANTAKKRRKYSVPVIIALTIGSLAMLVGLLMTFIGIGGACRISSRDLASSIQSCGSNQSSKGNGEEFGKYVSVFLAGIFVLIAGSVVTGVAGPIAGHQSKVSAEKDRLEQERQLANPMAYIPQVEGFCPQCFRKVEGIPRFCPYCGYQFGVPAGYVAPQSPYGGASEQSAFSSAPAADSPQPYVAAAPYASTAQTNGQAPLEVGSVSDNKANPTVSDATSTDNGADTDNK